MKQLQMHNLYIIIAIKLLQTANPQKSLRAHIFPNWPNASQSVAAVYT